MVVGDTLIGTTMRIRRKQEQGQAAIEFVFALLFIIIITAALFQALAFELDVFNQSMLARYELLRIARQNQDTTPCRSFNQPFQGKKIKEFAPWGVPYQTVNRNLYYGPKRLYGERGTKHFDRLEYSGIGLHAWGYWFALLTVDHYEGTADKLSGPLKGIISALALELPFRGC
jgi:hypothetical protein